MSSNRGIRRRMEKLFGKYCMIETLGIRNIPIEERRKIKGYKKSQERLTYHHIKERKDGGIRSIENGALIKGYNHTWLHTLKEEEKEEINNDILLFKATILQLNGKEIEHSNNIKFNIEFNENDDYLSIPIYDNINKKQKFNRAKEKQRFNKEIKDYER